MRLRNKLFGGTVMPVCSICGRTLKNKTVLKVHELYCKGPQANTEKNPMDASVKDEPDDENSPSEEGNEEILQDVEDEPQKPSSDPSTYVIPAKNDTPQEPAPREVSDNPPPEEKKKGFLQQIEDELGGKTADTEMEKKGFFQQIEDELSGKTADTEMEKKGNLSIDEELNA